MTRQVKLLSILRHAKSSWKDTSLDDHERPLNKRGKRDAPRMGRLMRDQGLVPDVILCSTARRAQDTVEKAADTSGFGGEIRLVRGLYHGDPEAYLEAASQLPDDVAHAMVVGHNPVLEDLLATLIQQSRRMPTAALAVVELSIATWTELRKAPRGQLRGFWQPRDLDG